MSGAATPRGTCGRGSGLTIGLSCILAYTAMTIDKHVRFMAGGAVNEVVSSDGVGTVATGAATVRH